MSKLDWILYVTDCDAVGDFIVRASGWNGDHGDNRGVCALGYTCLHEIGG